MRKWIALIFRFVFQSRVLKPHYYGVHKYVFSPLNLFKGLTMKIRYRNDIVLNLHLEDWIQQNLFFLNEYEEKEIRFVEQFLKPGDTFVDIGANIGLFSLVAARQVGPSGKIFSFEPITANYNSLVSHLELNSFKQVRPEKLAVSHVEETLILYLNDQDKNRGMATAYADAYTYLEQVHTIPFDIYVEQNNVSGVKLIKIDIEGGEYHALLGMMNVLKKYKPTLLIEINTNAPFGQEQVEKIVFDLGYKKYFIDRQGRIIPNKLDEDASCNYVFMAEE